MSPKSAGLAKKTGHSNTRVYLAGEPAWVKAGLPTYSSQGFVSKGNIVLIDLRSPGKSQASRIARSISIPAATLAERLDEIPKKAPVVLYSDDESESTSAMALLRKEGFGKVSLVEGGVDRWAQAGNKMETGPVPTSITWQRQLGEGEVSAAEFLQAAGSSSGPMLLDVRTKEEAAAGKYPTAISIPLDEIGKRIAELPRDRKIYTYCSTGARAEMAYRELKENGYAVSFVVANIECEGATCTLTE